MLFDEPQVRLHGLSRNAGRGIRYIEDMRRRGWSNDTINTLKKAYRIVYRDKLTLEAAIVEAEKLVAECPEVGLFIDSLKASTRGIVR